MLKVSNTLAHLEHVALGDLVPFQGNLKDLSEREYEKLKKSLTENGIVVPFFVYDNTNEWVHEKFGAVTHPLADGHQRLRVMKNEGWEIDVPIVRVTASDEVDAKKKLLVISSQYGHVTQEGWDEFTADIEGEWLKATVMFDALPLEFDHYGEDVTDDPYTSKIVSPVYEPSDEEPPLGSLYDDARTTQLLAEIEGCPDLPEDVRRFLRLAAHRHTQFNYAKVADFYAHAPIEIQLLMENSALVIIDFEKALELGYASLTQALMEQVGIEYPDG
jgi:hypothetical protein